MNHRILSRLLILWLIVVAIVVFYMFSHVTRAQAHDMWSNGEPVPAWVKTECCGIADAHHLRPDQVHAVEGGYKIDGYKDVIPYSTKKISPDDEWWVFYATYADGSQSPVYCFFGPAEAI